MGQPFEESEAWRRARELTNRVYLACRQEPLSRDFGLRDQIQRASVSVMNNIAEGWESLHAAEKRQAYNYARRSCGEVRSMLYVLLDNGFVTEPMFRDLMETACSAGRLVSGLMRTLDTR